MDWSFRRFPEKRPAQIFAGAAILGRAIWRIAPVRYILGGLSKFISLIVIAIAPTVPYHFVFKHYFLNSWKRLWTVYLITVFFCFGMNVLITLFITHTWSGTDPLRLYLSQDYFNLILEYPLITPICVTFSISLIVDAKNCWWDLRRLADVTVPPTYRDSNPLLSDETVSSNNMRRFTAAMVVSLLLTAIFIIRFILGTLDPTTTAKVYWWVVGDCIQ